MTWDELRKYVYDLTYQKRNVHPYIDYKLPDALFQWYHATEIFSLQNKYPPDEYIPKVKELVDTIFITPAKYREAMARGREFGEYLIENEYEYWIPVGNSWMLVLDRYDLMHQEAYGYETPVREKPSPDIVVWRDYVDWRPIAKWLGDWKIYFIVTINLNWLRNLIAQVLAFIANLIVNIIVLSLSVIRILADIVAAMMAIVVAPIIAPMWYAYATASDEELITMASAPTGEWNVLDFIWGAGAGKWEKSFHEWLWKMVAEIYSVFGIDKQAMPPIKRMLRRSVFGLVLKQLGVASTLEALRCKVVAWLRPLQEKLEEFGLDAWNQVKQWAQSSWNWIQTEFPNFASWVEKRFEEIRPEVEDMLSAQRVKIENWVEAYTSYYRDGYDSFVEEMQRIEDAGIQWRYFIPLGITTRPIGRILIKLYNGIYATKITVNDLWQGWVEALSPPTEEEIEEVRRRNQVSEVMEYAIQVEESATTEIQAAKIAIEEEIERIRRMEAA